MFGKTSMVIALLGFLFSGIALPNTSIAGLNIVAVKSLKNLSDDASVVLEGYVIKQTREEHYMFKDDTGQIEIDVDEDILKGVKLTPGIKVRISGEVDKNDNGVSVDVDHLEIIK